MRVKEPEIVTLYRQQVRQSPPKVCHTCDNYAEDGNMCLEFSQEPPEWFTRTVGVCDLWTEEVPF